MNANDTIRRLLKGMLSLTMATLLFTSVNGCMLLAAGAAGAGAGYIAGSAAEDDKVHVVHEKEVIVEERRVD